MSQEKNQRNNESDEKKVNEAIKLACDRRIGLLDTSFLCQSVGTLDPSTPLSLKEDATVQDALALFRKNRVGCVVITDKDGKLRGIFSERDYVLKTDPGKDLSKIPLSEVMTPEPVTTQMDTTVAYALNLMSHGGFRHLPIIDDGGTAVGMISVKDVVDHIVSSFISDLLAFE